MKTYYTYVLIDSLTNTIFYIGKGSGNRMYKHVQIAKGESICRNINKKLYNKIQKIIISGNNVIPLKVFENNDENLTLEYEKKLILELGIENLCNLTLGGEGTSYPDGFTEEHKQNMSNAKLGKKRKPITDKTKENMSNAQLGHKGYWKDKKIPENAKILMSLSHQNITFSNEHKENIRKSLQDVEKIDIDINKLKNLLELGYSQRKIAKEFECSPKTIKRRRLKYNLI
jgi:hypothetical protein